MKRLITFLATTLLLLMLVPKTAGAADFYVKKVGTGQMGLYLWIGDGGTGNEPLGGWDGCGTNLTGSYKDGDGNIWYKVSTDKVSVGTKIKYIVRADGNKSADPDDYFEIPSSGIVCIDWNGNSGGAVSSIADGSDKTFTEMLPNKIRYRVKGSTGAYVIQDVNFGGETKIDLVANKDYEFQISDENGIWYGLDGSASMVVGGANDWYLYANQDHCYLLTLKGGEYTFKVSKASGHISVTVVYPGVNLNDYKNKLMYRVDGTDDPAIIVPINYSGNGTAKVQLEKGRTYKFKISNNPVGDPTWFGSDETITSSKTKIENFENGKTAKIVADRTGEYTFTVSWKGGKPIVEVTYPAEDIPAYTLRYKVKDSSDAFTMVTLTDNTTATVSLSANTTYEYEISGPNSVWFGDQGNGTMNKDNCINWSFYKNKQCYIQTNTAGEYKFTVNWDLPNEKAVVSVAFPSVKVGKYYLVVPDENVGNTPRAISNKKWLPAHHKAFEMIAGRERNQNLLADDITSLTLKIDGNKGRQLRYDSEGKIKFYIYDETNGQFYQPGPDDYENAESEENGAYVDGNNVELRPKFRTSNNRDAIGSSHYEIKDGDQGRYYYINKEHATVYLDDNGEQVAYPTMSLTFMFSKYNGRKAYYKGKGDGPYYFDNGNCIYYVDGERKLGNAKLLVAFLKPRAFIPGTGKETMYYKEHIKDNGVYLVGSLTGGEFLNGSVTTPGDPKYYDKTKYEMKANRWFDGVIDNSRTDIEKADSIVYSCEIKKGDAGWEDFFLSFTTGDVLGKENEMWKPLLRPRVQNQMDAQALEGGIFYYLTNSDGYDSDQQQSLNPLLSEEQKKNYASYRVYFNATYSTYRIEFYDNFCIAGPAVNGQSNDTSKSGIYFDADHRYGMLEESVNGLKCYRYRGEFKKGSTFAFFVNPETSAYYYCEDDDNAAVNGNTGDRWHTQAPVGENGVATGADYPYHNKVSWQTDGSSDVNNPALGEGNAILWTLPDGVYTLRFYYHGENESWSEDKYPLYTIDKEVELKNVSSTFEVWNDDKTELVSKTLEYGGVRTFSDDCALMLPLGVKAYYANSIDEEKGRVNLKEISGNIIPAHCPVIIYDLSMKAGDNGVGRTAVKTINLCPVPGKKEYIKTLEEMVSNEADKVNYLVDLSTVGDDATIMPEADGKYNFCMTNMVNLNHDYTKKVPAPLNFWRANPNTSAKKNYTYLSVDKDIRPVFYTDAQNYVRPDASEDIANSKRSYCFILSFGDVDDDTVVTGITSVNAGDKTADSDAWYTIQGIRIAAPAVPGMYIHNGKKVVLK